MLFDIRIDQNRASRVKVSRYPEVSYLQQGMKQSNSRVGAGTWDIADCDVAVFIRCYLYTSMSVLFRYLQSKRNWYYRLNYVFMICFLLPRHRPTHLNATWGFSVQSRNHNSRCWTLNSNMIPHLLTLRSPKFTPPIPTPIAVSRTVESASCPIIRRSTDWFLAESLSEHTKERSKGGERSAYVQNRCFRNSHSVEIWNWDYLH